jgi:hypothetical protein
VVARDLPTLSYNNFIDGNGVCTEDFETMCAFIALCLEDIEFARECSQKSRAIGKHAFSVEAVRPAYLEAAERATILFMQGHWR